MLTQDPPPKEFRQDYLVRMRIMKEKKDKLD
jgi:hypothetical protein